MTVDLSDEERAEIIDMIRHRIDERRRLTAEPGRFPSIENTIRTLEHFYARLGGVDHKYAAL